MIEKKKFHTIEELQQLQYFATKCPENVGLHSMDGSIIVDAKSYIGIYALNFKEPILVVSESKEFFDIIEGIGETLE
ncbi:hypothetical protein [Faecalispora anaeroviscerum]|uniref:hypothetical protein n=1 Tax=Faecalispora anaeroviscerum TaxID=2991836 RepID=UPI0024B9B572|nr:hypothetical protein [Faecalispora anaeroviscerum]